MPNSNAYCVRSTRVKGRSRPLDVEFFGAFLVQRFSRQKFGGVVQWPKTFILPRRLSICVREGKELLTI